MTHLRRTAVVAAALAIAASSAGAITVPAGEQLVIQVRGTYNTASGNPITQGESLMFSNVVVSGIETSNNGSPIDLDGLMMNSPVGVTGDFVFDTGLVNDAVSLSFATNSPAIFDLDESTSISVPTLATGTYSVEGLGDLNSSGGTWGFSTSGAFTPGDFTFAIAVDGANPSTVIPLPAGALLMLGGLGGLTVLRRKR